MTATNMCSNFDSRFGNSGLYEEKSSRLEDLWVDQHTTCNVNSCQRILVGVY